MLQSALDVTCAPRCTLKRSGDPARPVLSLLYEVLEVGGQQPFIWNQAFSLVLLDTQHNKSLIAVH